MTERLTMILPQDVRRAWPSVREPIAEIARACGEPWMAEDVFLLLLAENAYLWALDDFSGFLVVQIAPEPYGRELHCWICYNKSGEPPIAYWDQLLEIAREQNCVAVTFENDRKGFQRAIPGLRVRYKYRAELS